jgi:hypothetical protein
MAAKPGEAESAQVGTIPKREGAREKATDPTGHFTMRNRWLRVPCVSAPSPLKHIRKHEHSPGAARLPEPGRTVGLIIIKGKEMKKTTQPSVGLSPEAELIQLAATKGQTLTAKTLRVIKENIELRRTSLQDFVALVRPHFKNRITNPSGFLIASSRSFRELSAAALPADVLPVAEPETCADCGRPKGKGFQIIENRFVPCETCATTEWRAELEEANRRDKRS